MVFEGKIPNQDILTKDDVILVTGGSGLFGDGMKIAVKEKKVRGKWVFMSSKDCDLTKRKKTFEYFKKIKPTYVIHLAAIVGGLYKNSDPAWRISFWVDNVDMNNNVLLAANEVGVKICMSSLSTCIFPDGLKPPYDEDMMLAGPPHLSNAPYAYAKRTLGLFGSWLNDIKEVKTRYLSVVPTNIYGRNDDYNEETSHVVPGMIHRCFQSKKNKKPFTIWGSGKPLRQFVFNVDAAEALLAVMFNYKGEVFIPVVSNVDEEVSIKQLAMAIVSAMKFKGKVVFDTKKSDGQFRKTVSNTTFRKLFPKFKFTSIEDGIKQTVDYYVENVDKKGVLRM